MRRVMILTNSLSGGGAERSMNLLSNELDKLGWPVSLVPINSGMPDQVAPTCELFPLERKWNGSTLNTLVSMWKFNKIVRIWKPDVIVLNCDLPELFGALLFGKHKLVALEHTSEPWGSRRLFGRITRRILRIRKVTWAAVSAHLTIWPSKEKPSQVLQNLFLFPNKFELGSMESEIKRLVFIGRLSHEKRPDLALNIAKATDLDLTIIGDGILKEELERDALQESIKSSFLGWVRDPWSEIQPGDLIVITSSFEGDGLIVIEGLARGLPMLVSDIPDLRRFDFPDRNYGKDLSGFVAQCEKYRHRLQDLCVPAEISLGIIEGRSTKIISQAWQDFLNHR
jgi:glycosyltransferase involved in cell wall biosynthesis